MKQKATIIIVEDDPEWLNKIRTAVEKNIPANIETFNLFEEAEPRIYDHPENIDVLVTDIRRGHSLENPGKFFAKFASEVWKIPVIVVTADEQFVKTAWKGLRVAAIFEKGAWNRMEFVNALHSALANRPSRHDPSGGGNGGSSPESGDGEGGNDENDNGRDDKKGPWY